MKSLSDIKSAIEEGNLNTAKRALEQYEVVKVRELAEYAELCRRLSANLLAIKKLRPFIYERGRVKRLLNDPARVEYAFNLHWLGINQEALRLFDSVDQEKNPKALLAKSFIFFQEWSYARSIPLLLKYLESDRISDYDDKVGKVNLLLAYSEMASKETPELYLELKKLLKGENFKLLDGHVERIYAQYWLNKKEAQSAKKHLEEASKVFKDSQDFGFLEYQRNVFLFDILLKNKVNKDDVSRFRKIALNLKYYEPLRFVEFHLAVFEKNLKRLNEIYWRTPHKMFREMIKKGLKMDFDPLVKVGDSTKNIKLNLEKGMINNKFLPKKNKGFSSKLLSLILGDFLRPYSSAESCDLIFKDNFYDPKYSKDKLFQGLKRTNAFLSDSGIDLEITYASGNGVLKTNSSIEVLFETDNENNDLTIVEEEIMSFIASSKGASSKEISSARQCKLRIVQYHLNELLRKEKIKKERNGRAVKYVAS